MSTYIKNVEASAAARGWTAAKANRAVNVNNLGDNVNDQDYSRPMVRDYSHFLVDSKNTFKSFNHFLKNQGMTMRRSRGDVIYLY